MSLNFIDSYKAGKISLNRARSFALKALEKSPRSVGQIFKADILTREEAHPYAIKLASLSPYDIVKLFQVGIFTKEEAREWAINILPTEPNLVALFFDSGIISQDDARPFVVAHLKSQQFSLSVQTLLMSYSQLQILPRAEITQLALESFEHLKEYPEELGSGVIRLYTANILSPQQAALYTDYLGATSYLSYFRKEGIITEDRARQLALTALRADQLTTTQAVAYNKEGLITEEELKPVLQKSIQQSHDPSSVAHSYINSGFLTAEDVHEPLCNNPNLTCNGVRTISMANLLPQDKLREVALRVIEKDINFHVYWDTLKQIVTQEDVQHIAITHLENAPVYWNTYLSAGILTATQVESFARANFRPSEVLTCLKYGIFNVEEAKTYVRQSWDSYFNQPQLLSELQANGLIPLEEARELALSYVRNREDGFTLCIHFYQDNLITLEEARARTLKFAKRKPEAYLEPLVNAGILTLREARPIVQKKIASNKGSSFSYEFLDRLKNPYKNLPVFNQMEHSGVDVESLIDDDLKYLLDEFQGKGRL